MRLFAEDLTTDTLQHIAARGLSEAGGPKPLLLRVLVDLFVRRPSHSDEEIQHFAEIVHTIWPSATRDEIDHAAHRLATHPAAPGEVIDLLAREAREGAITLFAKSRRVASSILHHTAACGTHEAASALATRDDLDPEMIDLLVARGTPDIWLRLAENVSAPLSHAHLAAFVKAAQSDAALSHALTERFPHRVECLPLFLQASRLARLVMIHAAKERAGIDDGTATQILEHSAETALRRCEAAAQESREAFSIVLGEILPGVKDKALHLCDDHGGEALVLTLRALGADPATIARIAQSLDPHLTEGQLIWRQSLAMGLPRSIACTIVEAITGEPFPHVIAHDHFVHEPRATVLSASTTQASYQQTKTA